MRGERLFWTILIIAVAGWAFATVMAILTATGHAPL